MFWKMLSYFDYKSKRPTAKFRCSECGYIINDIYIQKWKIVCWLPIRLPQFVEVCPNCGAKTTIEEYFAEYHKEFKEWSKQMETNINKLWYDLITEKAIQSDKKYI